MGNHDAGRAMVQTATALAEQREKTGQTALEILDIACNPYKGCDAEFDDDQNPEAAFGKLMIEAFAPDGKYDPANDDDGEIWWDVVAEPFRKRYELC